MDAKYLAEIKAREQAATKGPWSIDTNEPFSRQINGVFSDKQGRYVFYHDPDGENTVSKEDADFIAHARADIPALLAEAERLQKCRDGCKIDCLLEQYNQAQEQISKLKAEKARAENALELACQYHRFDDFKTVQAEMDFFTKQAQEREGKK